MAWTGARHGRTVGAGSVGWLVRFDMHCPLPVFPVLVWNQQRDGCARRDAVANAAQRLGAIGLDRHATAAAVPALASAQLGRDSVEVHRQSGRNALENRDERLAVRLAGSEKSQHRCLILSEIFARSGEAAA